MNVEEYMNDARKKAEENYKEGTKYVAKQRAEYANLVQKFNALKDTFAKETDTIKKLTAANGREVEITTYSWRSLNIEKIQPLKYEGERVLINGCMSTPLIGDDCIVTIKDAKTGEIIYSNPYYKDPLPIQKGIILGLEKGEKSLAFEEESVKYWENYYKETYERTLKSIDNIPQWIEEGKKYIYPEKLDEWEECVCYRAADLYHGSELVNALQIMKALDEGKTLEEVKPMIDEGHSGMSFSMLCKIVLHFSKRGPEFCRKFSHQYEFAEGKEKEELEAYYKNIEEKNAEYEKNLQNGNGENE